MAFQLDGNGWRGALAHGGSSVSREYLTANYRKVVKIKGRGRIRKREIA